VVCPLAATYPKKLVIKLDWKKIVEQMEMYILNPIGLSRSLRAQVDNQTVFGGLKVIAMKGFVGNRVIVRPFNVSNAVDLVAGQIFRQSSSQMFTYTFVRLPVRFREI